MNIKYKNRESVWRCLILLAFVCLSHQQTFAQEPSSHQKSYYQGPDGKLYWNKYLPFYLSISPTPTGKGVLLESKVTAEYANPAYFDTEGLNYIRTQYAVDTVTMKTITPHMEIKWEVYADGLAPISTLSFHGAPRYASDDVLYFGKKLRASVISIDQMSGLRQNYFATNQSSYLPYSDTISFNSEGTQTLDYYAVDYVGNVETPKQKKFTVDLTAPNSKIEIKGRHIESIICTDSRLHISSKDELSGVDHIIYQIDDEAPIKSERGRVIDKNHLPDGEHTITYYAVDNVENQEPLQTETYYLDRLAPLLASDILGDRYVANGKTYFSGRTKLKLTAVDNKSGVEEVLFSLDNKKFETYKNPFYLPSSSGEHLIQFYAVDKIGNKTFDENTNNHLSQYSHNVRRVHLDLTGPSISYKIEGKKYTKRRKVYIHPETNIILNAHDTESGLQNRSYSIDKALEETSYTDPIQLKEEGKHVVEFFAYDNVNNRNKTKATFYVDGTPPELHHTFTVPPYAKSDEGIDRYPKYVELYLSASDAIIGNDKIMYSVNDAPFKQYKGKISGFKSGITNTVKAYALDKLGNKKEQTFVFLLEEE